MRIFHSRRLLQSISTSFPEKEGTRHCCSFPVYTSAVPTHPHITSDTNPENEQGQSTDNETLSPILLTQGGGGTEETVKQTSWTTPSVGSAAKIKHREEMRQKDFSLLFRHCWELIFFSFFLSPSSSFYFLFRFVRSAFSI
ncbi:hypothetical protein CEXT_285521 [Caerostris extrusa]|uniref:Uncharacterized protein n=1 Tax=Caerostris extrusa TaxID=172846 RepID=A0AAV4VAV9_CAEEX|nr:hypothetical protein CEXT_285521 [Caerostris extrusa]